MGQLCNGDYDRVLKVNFWIINPTLTPDPFQTTPLLSHLHSRQLTPCSHFTYIPIHSHSDHYSTPPLFLLHSTCIVLQTLTLLYPCSFLSLRLLTPTHFCIFHPLLCTINSIPTHSILPLFLLLLIPTSSLSLYSIASKLRDWILNFSFYCLISILYKEVFTRKIIMLLGGIFLKIILGGGLMRNWWVSEKKKLNVQWQCQKKLISSCPGGTLKLLHTFFF